MLFSEVYSNYFHTVSAILAQAVEGRLTGEKMNALVQEYAFGESALVIPAALRSGEWPLLTPELETPLDDSPVMPLTLLEKRWLKTLLQDPRIQLFNPDPAGLEDIEPLYDMQSIIYYDRSADGDPYADEHYIHIFRILLASLETEQHLRIEYRNHRGKTGILTCLPLYLEYSPKDDKFRLVARTHRDVRMLNLVRILSVQPCDSPAAFPTAGGTEASSRYFGVKKESLTLELTDERNALERAMIAFSDLEKETVRLDDNLYRVQLRYRKEDETETLIRILSFGPVLRVTAPERMREQIRLRLQRQAAFFLRRDS